MKASARPFSLRSSSRCGSVCTPRSAASTGYRIAAGLALLLLPGNPFSARAANPQPANQPAGQHSSAPSSEVSRLLKRYCFECHGKGQSEGGVVLDTIREFKDAKPDMWESLHEQIQLGHMPPKEGDQPSSEERDFLVSWITSAMRTAGHHLNNKMEWPNYGNYTPHDPLFRGPAHPAPATSVRLWRQRPGAYASRNGNGTQAFSMLPGQQVSDFSSLYTVDESAAEIILRNAEHLVKGWTPLPSEEKKAPAVRPLSPAFARLLDPAQTGHAEALREGLQSVFRWALNRAASEEELARIAELHQRITEAHGPVQGARSALMVPLLEPEAIYRLELGAGSWDAHGRRRLSKAEILNAIQHTLFTSVDAPPVIQKARAETGHTLDSREAVADLIREILATPAGPHSAQERMLGFFDEYFDYRKAKDVFKDIPGSLSFTPSIFIEETQRLIATLVAEDKDVFVRLLTTSQGYAGGHPSTILGGQTHRLYNLPPDWRRTRELTQFAPDQRAGILTQPSWLVAYSGNFDNDPVRRGKWVLEHLLGGTVPDVPVTVCANVPRDDTRTLRARYEIVSKDAYCWKCHEQMNQLGMAFEVFDHYGRYRLRELNEPASGLGAVVGSGVEGLDGDVADALELIHRLAPSKRAQEMFVRYAFRYFIGRNETLRDAQTLRDANDAYGRNGGSMRALVVSLLSSDSFLYRTLQP